MHDLPKFSRSSSALWLLQLENHFYVNNVSDQRLRYFHVTLELPDGLLSGLRLLPGLGFYKNLLQVVISHCGITVAAPHSQPTQPVLPSTSLWNCVTLILPTTTASTFRSPSDENPAKLRNQRAAARLTTPPRDQGLAGRHNTPPCRSIPAPERVTQYEPARATRHSDTRSSSPLPLLHAVR